jgi:hypothetical protein
MQCDKKTNTLSSQTSNTIQYATKQRVESNFDLNQWECILTKLYIVPKITPLLDEKEIIYKIE